MGEFSNPFIYGKVLTLLTAVHKLHDIGHGESLLCR